MRPFALALWFLWGPLWAAEPLTIGVLVYRTETQTTEQWKPLQAYLNATVPGHSFTVKAFNLIDLRAAINRAQVDLVITQPAEYVRMTHESGLSSPVATLLSSHHGKPVRVLGGVIVTRRDRADINGLNDLIGKSVATPSKQNFGSYQVQAYSLKKAKVVPGSIIETGLAQDTAVEAVLQGKADVAFVRSGLIEAMASEGKLDVGALKVVEQQNFPGYPFAVSSALYPEWPVIALPHVPEKTAAQLAGALLLMPHGTDLTRKLGIYGFSVPADYDSVRTVMREMKVPPFDVERRLSLADIWNDHRPLIIAMMVSVIAITLLAIRSTVLSRKLKHLNKDLEVRIRERTSELDHRNTELAATLFQLNLTRDELVESAKLAALGSMVAGIAHELNTPIGNGLTVATTLEGRTEELKKALGTGIKRSTLDNFVADAALASDILVRNLEKAAELVSSFKQVAVDQSSSQRRKFMLHDTLTEVLLTLGPNLKEAKCQVHLSELPQDLPFDSYPGPLGQVINNLISNSVLHGYKDGNPGDIRIVVSQAADGQVLIEVADDGVGIDSANLAHIFDPFFTTRLGKGGSGLGLSIARNIVVGTLGGKLSVKSTKGQGATFLIAIPQVAPSVRVV